MIHFLSARVVVYLLVRNEHLDPYYLNNHVYLISTWYIETYSYLEKRGLH